MDICRSGRFRAADLSACVSAGPMSEPTLRRLASAVDVGTRVRKGSSNNTLPETLPGCWPSSAMLRPCTSQASQCGAKSRTARHLRTFPFCCFTKCFNTVPEGTEARWRDEACASAGASPRRADWAWLRQVVGLLVWSDGSRRSCCWLCNARFVVGSYDDASLAAEWRSSLVDTLAF